MAKEESTLKVQIHEVTSGTDNTYLNYGHCHICGGEHLLDEDGTQCGKG